MGNYDIVVVGSCNIDMHWFVENMPYPGETILGNKFIQGYGGKGANEAVAAAKLGANTALIAMVGEDLYGKDYLHNLKINNVDVEHIGISKEAATGMASITIDKQGQNFIVVIPGANWTLTPLLLNNILYGRNKAEGGKVECKVLITQREVPDQVVLEALKFAKGYFSSTIQTLDKEDNTITVFNPSPIKSYEREQLLESGIFDFCDIVVLNEVEIGILLNNSNTDKNNDEKDDDILKYKTYLVEMMNLLPNIKAIVLTLGKLGVLFCENNNNSSNENKNITPLIKHVVAPKVDAIDSSGAGDSFLGSLCYYCALYPNLDLHQKINRACYIATQTVKRRGTQSSYPTKQQLPSFLF